MLLRVVNVILTNTFNVILNAILTKFCVRFFPVRDAFRPFLNSPGGQDNETY